MQPILSASFQLTNRKKEKKAMHIDCTLSKAGERIIVQIRSLSLHSEEANQRGR